MTSLGVNLHPTPWQTKPAMQHPPPWADAHGVLSPVQLPTVPPHVDPDGQQPMFPSPVSVTMTHVSSVSQQLYGYPILAQLLVPLGQLHCLPCNLARDSVALRKISHANIFVLDFFLSGSSMRA